MRTLTLFRAFKIAEADKKDALVEQVIRGKYTRSLFSIRRNRQSRKFEAAIIKRLTAIDYDRDAKVSRT